MSSITVQQLREMLVGIPDDAIVVVAKDAEGNSFSPLATEDGVIAGHYDAETTWRGEFHWPQADDDEPADTTGMARAVCLWPIN